MMLGKTQCRRAAWTMCGAFALVSVACASDKTQPAKHPSELAPVASSEPAASAITAAISITVEPVVSDRPIDWEKVAIPGSGIAIYRSKSDALSAQFEHTVLVTPDGHEVLTR